MYSVYGIISIGWSLREGHTIYNKSDYIILTKNYIYIFKSDLDLLSDRTRHDQGRWNIKTLGLIRATEKAIIFKMNYNYFL